VKTAASAQPATLDEVKTFGRLDSVDEDSLIELFIQAATQAAEEYMGRSIMQQTIVMAMDFFPGITALLPRYLATSAMPVPLPRLPLVEVTALRTLYEDGTTLENWDLSNAYWLTGDDARLAIRKGSVPPINVERYRGGFEIEYTAGYGVAGDDAAAQRRAVPASIRMGIMLWANVLYASRGVARSGDKAGEPPPEAKPLLDPYKVVRI
jgi:uncharacterized phiE125 gp8 family phage protein